MSKNLTAMCNYMMQKDIDAQKFFSGKVPDTDFIIKSLHPQLHDIVDTALKADVEAGSEEAQYQSVLGMVYTLIEEGRLSELYRAIKEKFPEYYIA